MDKDVLIIGGGVSGVTAALMAIKNANDCILIEKEETLLPRMLKSETVIHRTLLNDNQKESELASSLIKKIEQSPIQVWLKSYVRSIVKDEESFLVDIVTKEGIKTIRSKTVISATGSLEIPYAPSKTMNTDLIGYYTREAINQSIYDFDALPFKNVALFGQSIETLKLAERLNKLGISVQGVYTTSNEFHYDNELVDRYLTSNDIKFYPSHTIISYDGVDRIKNVFISRCDEKGIPIRGTIRNVFVDSIVYSEKELPNFQLFKSLGLDINKDMSSPITDQDGMSSEPGLFFVGNSLFIIDDIDLIILQAKECGFQASRYRRGEKKTIDISYSKTISSIYPQRINLRSELINIPFLASSKEKMGECTFKILLDGKEIHKTKFDGMEPFKIERIMVDLSRGDINENSIIEAIIE